MISLDKYVKFPRVYLRNLLLFGIVTADWVLPWQIWIPALGVKAPAMAVVSGSMEPTHFRFDVAIQYKGSFDVTDQTVFESKVSELSYPIIHRMSHKYTSKKDGEVRILTWGDNNQHTDQSFYDGFAHGAPYSSIQSKAVGSLGGVGTFAIAYQEMPLFRYLVKILTVVAIEGGSQMEL